MGEIKLNSEEFNSTYAQILKASNEQVIDAMGSIASILKSHSGESAVIDQCLDNCKALQKSYNEGFYDSLTNLKKTYDGLFDLSEYMEKKANIGSVSQVDTGFKAGTFDPSGVMV